MVLIRAKNIAHPTALTVSRCHPEEGQKSRPEQRLKPSPRGKRGRGGGHERRGWPPPTRSDPHWHPRHSKSSPWRLASRSDRHFHNSLPGDGGRCPSTEIRRR